VRLDQRRGDGEASGRGGNNLPGCDWVTAGRNFGRKVRRAGASVFGLSGEGCRFSGMRVRLRDVIGKVLSTDQSPLQRPPW